MEKNNKDFLSMNTNQEGKIGYVIAWILGVPASLLFVIFFLRGCQ